MRKLTEAKRKKIPTVYLDEILFTKRTMLNRCYSNKNTAIAVDQNEVMVPYKAAIVAVSADKGVVLL